MNAAHIVALVMDSNQPNNLFRSPIGENPKNILDIGTGNGAWAVDTADRCPDALVQGVDLFPVPDTWMPPNCRFDVDHGVEPWVLRENGTFDLIHIRYMLGAFSPAQWEGFYKQVYDTVAPGGWIEHFEPVLLTFKCLNYLRTKAVAIINNDAFSLREDPPALRTHLRG